MGTFSLFLESFDTSKLSLFGDSVLVSEIGLDFGESENVGGGGTCAFFRVATTGLRGIKATGFEVFCVGLISADCLARPFENVGAVGLCGFTEIFVVSVTNSGSKLFDSKYFSSIDSVDGDDFITLTILRGRGRFIILGLQSVVSSPGIMDKLFKRGLRQLRLTQRIIAPKRELEVLDKNEIRKKVQSLHEFEEDLEEWGVGSKFQMEAFQLDEPQSKVKKASDTINDLKMESIIKFISESSASDNIKLYQPDEGDSEKLPQLILSLPSTPSRRALLQSILIACKPLFPKRHIAVDGDTEKKADWIVIDLKSVIVHIFDPQTRIEVDLDGKLEKELGSRPDDSLPTFINNFTNSLPRSIASRPNFVEKYLKNKQ